MTITVRREDWENDKQFNAIRDIALEIDRLVNRDSWSPTLRGSSTAGTYETSTRQGSYVRIGSLLVLNFTIVLAGAITGGGTGDLEISGIPPQFKLRTGTNPVGSVYLSGVDWTAGANLSIIATSTPTIKVLHTLDNAGATLVPISGVAANDAIAGTLVCEVQ